MICCYLSEEIGIRDEGSKIVDCLNHVEGGEGRKE